MLNISNNRVPNKEEIISKYSSFNTVEQAHVKKGVLYTLITLFVCLLIVLFLPWTQNISANGELTSLNPQNREQSIQSRISGRIDSWYVQEGVLVQAGDTILKLGEIKEDYLDTALISRTKSQAEIKNQSAMAYSQKVLALENQIQTLKQLQKIKLEQADNKLRQTYLKMKSDSMNFETEKTNYNIAVYQFERQKNLYDQGLKSLTELEQRKLKKQEAENKLVYAENNFNASKNEWEIAKLNISSTKSEYQEKIAKSVSDKMAAESDYLAAKGDFIKLKNQEANYTKRAEFYWITAPQSGYITKAIKTGIGEVIKEGEVIFTFIPENQKLAVAFYVKPVDLPLLKIGTPIRLQFDGWPALVFAGWPDMSFGTYGGIVVGFDKVLSENGKFRVLIAPDPNDLHQWPDLLRLGSGARGIALLNEVPVWYEIWRNVNGFPPDYYSKKEKNPDYKK